MSIRISVSRRCKDQSTLEQRLACLADAGPQAITDRLNEIESEWSAGRMTKAMIGVLILTGLVLTAFFSAWWLILPALGGLFLLQYVFTRMSWLGATFREMGFRSGAEIDQEKFALKALRGDFRNLPTVMEIENKEDISRLEGEGGIALDPEEAKPDTKEVVKEAIEAAKS
ncbi:MAG: hypothetical protein L0241_32190 [Planctomycetia bacterium]|nr:hypothetical protein [Planctomycetia bacterium]